MKCEPDPVAGRVNVLPTKTRFRKESPRLLRTPKHAIFPRTVFQWVLRPQSPDFSTRTEEHNCRAAARFESDRPYLDRRSTAPDAIATGPLPSRRPNPSSAR